MFRKDAEKELRMFTENAHEYEIKQINDRIYHITGLGHSNVIAIEGNTSWIIVDALDCDTRALKLKEELEKIAIKPIATIIFTHGHFDHHAGSGVFKDSVKEAIAFRPRKAPLKYYEKLDDILKKRTKFQFGYELNDDECITQGLGIREGIATKEGKPCFLEPTTYYDEDVVERVIDGVKMKLVSAVGETDDQIFVWLPDDAVLCCGDNYYACFPNLYALRGSQYRDIATWIASLDNILSYPAEVLLPGHMKAIIGYKHIQETLGDYRDMMEYILLHTLTCMNQGMREDETVHAVKLPAYLADKPYLQEYYGTVEWSVRSIYHGYFGWFDGNATNLARLDDVSYDTHLYALIGGVALKKDILQCYEKEQYQLGVQLCDIALSANKENKEYRMLKAKGLRGLAKYIISANGRHYYICSAKELESVE